jgi:hypothetical protein
MSDSFGEGQRPPANDGWQGLRLGQTDQAKHTVAAKPPAVAKRAISSAPKSIPYAQRAYPVTTESRPGGLTALGVISIVVGAITLLVNGGMVLVLGYGYLMVSDRQTRSAAVTYPSVPQTPAAIVPAPANLIAYTGDCVAADGLPRPARRAVIDAVRAKWGKTLSPDRAAMLDRLLAETGTPAFGSDGSLIPEIHLEPGGTVDGSPAVRLTTPRGLVEVDDNTAAFTPAGANKPSLRIIRNIVVTPESRRYSALAIGDALEMARGGAGGNLNAVQGAVALDELRSASVREWPEGRFEPIPIGEVYSGRNGTVGLTAGDRSMWIFADGRTVDRRANPREPDPVTGAPIATPVSVITRPVATPAVDMASMALVGTIEAVIGLALAVLILVGGIRLLNNSPSALSQHALYAVLKVALLVATVIVWYAGISRLLGPFGRGIGKSTYQIERQVGIVLGMVAQVAYPIAIFCVLGNRGIRRYARERGWDFGVVSPQAWRRLRTAMETAAGRRMLMIGGLGALAVAGLHGWCLYGAALSARTPHLAALAGAGAVALGCLARRMMTTKSVVAVAAALVITLSARGQSAEPATQPAAAATQPAPRPKIILQLGKPVGNTLNAPAATAPKAVVAVSLTEQVIDGTEWFYDLRSMSLNNRANRLSAMSDIDKLVVSQAARAAATEAVPAITEVLLSVSYPGHAQAMTLLEKIGPCEPVEMACVRVMAAPSLESLRPRAVALALAVDPTGKSTTTKLRPYVLSGHGMAYVQRSAARSMAQLGDAGAAELNALIYSADNSVRPIAAAALADSAPVEKRLTMMARLLDDPSPAARIDAVNALAAMGPAGHDVLIEQIFKHPECLRALQRTPGRNGAIYSSLYLLTQSLRIDEKAQAKVIEVVRAIEAGHSAEADRALLGCLESDVPPLRQWASGIVGDSGFMQRAGPVTQARVLALMGQARFSPIVRMPLVAAPSAPADAPAWVMPSERSLSAMTATQEVSEPPSALAWWATGGLVLVMTFCLRRLARCNHAQGDLEAEVLDDDPDNRQAPGMAA